METTCCDTQDAVEAIELKYAVMETGITISTIDNGFLLAINQYPTGRYSTEGKFSYEDAVNKSIFAATIEEVGDKVREVLSTIA